MLEVWYRRRPSDMLMRRVRIFRQLGVTLLLGLSYLTPVMTCVLPDAQMSAQERACCRAMDNQCGQTEMPASHGCCHKAPPTLYEKFLASRAEAQHIDLTLALWLTPSELFSTDSSAIGWVEHHESSPPQSPPSTISILRI